MTMKRRCDGERMFRGQAAWRSGSSVPVISRRSFLAQASVLATSGLFLLSPNTWAARTTAGGKSRLIVVFLRGAVDGLNVVVPYGEARYYEDRPTISIPRPERDNGALDLNGFFGLHPALASVMPLWRDGSLAFVHGCGSPDPTRSHFDAQDYMESGTPGVKTTSDGWMNRVLAARGGSPAATAALSLGPTVPRILAGRLPVANLPLGRAGAQPIALDRDQIAAAFDRLYNGSDPLSHAYQEGRAARRQLLAELQEDMRMSAAGAPASVGFAADADRLARLMGRDSTIQLAFAALGGWDTHVTQGAVAGQLAGHLKPLGEGLAALAAGLGPAFTDTVILVLSEFGRTVRENGNAGTDHGHGTVMWILGGPVKGQKVYGRWPGLAAADLYEDRDVAVTTDFREVLTTVLSRHFGLTDSQLDRVFPGRPRPTGSVRGLIAT
jgi:uncharacterized protein (DUF1501 family)